MQVSVGLAQTQIIHDNNHFPFFLLFNPALFKHKTITDSTQNNLWHRTKQIKCEISGLCFVWLYKQSLHLLCQHHKEKWATKSCVKRARLWGNIDFLPFCAPLFAPFALFFSSVSPSLLPSYSIFFLSSFTHFLPFFLILLPPLSISQTCAHTNMTHIRAVYSSFE